jgi:site-specific recombinase XerD
MATTDFAKYLTAFFTGYLVGERGVSRNTIRAYSNTFTQLLTFMDEHEGIKADRLSLNHITRNVVLNFLDWLQNNRKSGNATRNNRLAAIHSFFRYMQYEDTKRIGQWQDILSVKVKKQERKSMNFSVNGIKFLLQQIPTDTKTGRRNLALMALLYDSGARVQELIDLVPSSLKPDKPYCVTLSGKGNKKRIVPLMEEQIKLLHAYMEENRLNEPAFNQRPLFSNNRGEKLTNSGITYILNMYAHNARMLKPELIPDKISPHVFRHSKAMHLLQAGVNLVYIRDILGHVSIQTTEIYARADSKLKREALETAYINVIPSLSDESSWEKDAQLKIWLKNLVK